eukprot:13497355-Alexandrium_andersonii.AAC.1
MARPSASLRLASPSGGVRPGAGRGGRFAEDGGLEPGPGGGGARGSEGAANAAPEEEDQCEWSESGERGGGP